MARRSWRSAAIRSRSLATKTLLKHLALFVVYGALCTVAVLVVGYLYYLQERPDLKPWHTANLDAEFRAADAATVVTLDELREQPVLQVAVVVERHHGQIGRAHV